MSNLHPRHRLVCCCASGLHPWLDPEDRKRCCNGYVRVMGTSRQELEEMGAEHIVLRQPWRGWLRTVAP